VDIGGGDAQRPMEAVEEEGTTKTQWQCVAGLVVAVQKTLKFLRHKEVWSIILGQYFQSWGLWGLLSWMPDFFHEFYGVDKEDWIFATGPYVIQGICGMLSGAAADLLISRWKVRTLRVRQVLQVVSMIGPAVFLMLAVLDVREKFVGSLYVGIGTGLSALSLGGVSVVQLDVAPQNAGFVFSLGNTAAIFAGLLAVPISGKLLDVAQTWWEDPAEGEKNRWKIVMLLFAVHYAVGAFFVCRPVWR